MADKSKAEELKNQGNAALQQGKTEEAINLYTQALAIDPTNFTYYGNRSAAYVKLAKFDEALKDADKSVQINDKWGKGYQRRGIALHNLRRFAEAVEAFKKGLTFEPENAQIKSGLESAQEALEWEIKQQKKSSTMQNLAKSLEELFKGDVVGRIRTMPEIEHLASDKDFLKKVEAIAKDSSKLSEYIQDQKISSYVSTALQYQKISQMSTEERAKLVQQQEEARMKREKEAELKRDLEKKAELERKKAEEAKKKEEELAKLTPDQRRALEIKENANKLYNEKKTLEALELYRQASELDPRNIVYLNNICAAYMELKEYGKVIEFGNKAVEIGRAERARFEDIGKALQRIGTAYFKATPPDYENAILYYQKSLTEHRDGQTLNLLKKVEKLWEEKQKQDYINPELSQKAKEEGNNFFRDSKFSQAVERYSEAIKRNPSDHTLYTNRAQAYIKLMALPQALKDCDESLQLKPDFIKAYLRKGQVQTMMKEYQKALKTYDDALKLDPDNQEITDAVKKTVDLISSRRSSDPESVKAAIEKDPELQAILADPVMQQVLKDIQENPQSINGYLSDSRIRENFNKLVAAGIIGI